MLPKKPLLIAALAMASLNTTAQAGGLVNQFPPPINPPTYTPSKPPTTTIFEPHYMARAIERYVNTKTDNVETQVKLLENKHNDLEERSKEVEY